MLRASVEKSGQVQEWMGDTSTETDDQRKSCKEMLEIRNTVIETKKWRKKGENRCGYINIRADVKPWNIIRDKAHYRVISSKRQNNYKSYAPNDRDSK